MFRTIIVTMPDPDMDPIEFDLMSLSDGLFAFCGSISMSSDEILALGTALKRWEVQTIEEREVTALEHATACRDASDITIETWNTEEQ